MKRYTSSWRAGLLCAAGLWIGAGAAAQEPTPIVDLQLPIDHYEDGTIKTQLKARRASVPEEGEVQAWDARMEFYTPDGKLDVVVISEQCSYDREKQWARSSSYVRVQREDAVLTGIGFDWRRGEQNVRILDRVKVVINRRLNARRKR